jgi:hypothetical protein
MIVVYDIETFKNCFSYTDRDYHTKEFKQFVIHKERNDLNLLIEYLSQKDLSMVGFNNVHFDYPVLHYLLSHPYMFRSMDVDKMCQMLYAKAQEIIHIERYYGIPENKVLIPQLDLFLIWHYDNPAKKTSLKDLQFAMQMDNIEEMPIAHDELVTEADIEKVLSYNKNDVIATELFLDVTLGRTEIPMYKGKDKLQLRKDIKNTFGINCVNFNDVKIGDTINKREYLKNAHLNSGDLKQLKYKHTPFKFKDCIPDYVQFKTKELQNFKERIGNIDVSLEGEKQVFNIRFKGTTYTIAKGGIHSGDTARRIIPTINEILRDADVGSQYPNAFRKRRLYPRHLGKLWLQGYLNNIIQRMDAKKEYKKTGDAKFNSIQECFKLALNGGGFGKTNEQYNWQFDPFVHFSCTIGNQFEILMLIEEMELNNIHVVSANTDGIVCLFDKSLEETYYKICKEWELIVGNEDLGQLEYADYSMLAQTSVNDYMAVYKETGKIKLKGDFEVDKEFHKDPSMRIVRIALIEYFVNGVPMSETIKKHSNIKDFCLRLKINKATLGLYNFLEDYKQKSIKLPRTTRYYVSMDGGSLIVYYNGSKSPNRINAGRTVTLCNRMIYHDNMDNYKIDYSFYEKECNKIISQIECTQQTLFDD